MHHHRRRRPGRTSRASRACGTSGTGRAYGTGRASGPRRPGISDRSGGTRCTGWSCRAGRSDGPGVAFRPLKALRSCLTLWPAWPFVSLEALRSCDTLRTLYAGGADRTCRTDITHVTFGTYRPDAALRAGGALRARGPSRPLHGPGVAPGQARPQPEIAVDQIAVALGRAVGQRGWIGERALDVQTPAGLSAHAPEADLHDMQLHQQPPRMCRLKASASRQPSPAS